MCASGIIALRSTDLPSVGIFIGITTSTPYGFPSVFSSSQVSTCSSSSGSLNRTAPSTPSPPARETAAATCSDGVKAKIGYSIPKRSHSSVRMGQAPVGEVATLAAKEANASSLALGYCALPVALRGISSTRVIARGSL